MRAGLARSLKRTRGLPIRRQRRGLGIGLVLAPLTLIGTSVALASPVRASGAVQAGAAFNLLLLVTWLSLLTLVWWPTSWFLFAIAWALLVAIVLLSYTIVLRRGQAGNKPSGGMWAM